jgi:hypothetical protein
MKTQREGSAAVAVGTEMVVVLGGYHSERKFLNCTAAFVNGQWKPLPDMISPRMGCGACSVGRKIIVVGGFQKGRTYLDTVEMLDMSLAISEWKQLAPMRNARAGCAVVGIPPSDGNSQGVVIVCGGWKSADTAVDTVEQFDIQTGTWSLLPSMLTARAGCSASVVSGNKIVVTGGYSNYAYCLSSAEVFDIATQTWSSLPSMRERRDASACCVVGNIVMVMGGGESSHRPSRTCEVLNMDKISEGWTSFPDLKSHRFGCAAAAMGNQIVVMGGRGSEGQHLECVETVTLPLLDTCKPKRPKIYQRQRSMSDASKMSVPEMSNVSSEEWRRMVDSTLKMANHMMAKDKARTNEAYERSRTHEMDECGRKVKEIEKKLKTLQLEKHKLQREQQKVIRQKDERLLELEEQRRQSIAEIEKNFLPLISKAANSSAPEHFTGDLLASISQSANAADLALLIKDEEDENNGPPEELICSITGVLMKDPVTAVDGHTYEREAIEIWFSRFKTGKPTSPMTNEKLSSRRLIPSHNIRSQCQNWLEREEKLNSELAENSSSDITAAEVQSCVEPNHWRGRSSTTSRPRSSSARRPHRTRQSDERMNRAESSRTLRVLSSSASRSSRRSSTSRRSSASRRTDRLDTEPPSPLGRSFTLFSRRSSAQNMAATRRPSH